LPIEIGYPSDISDGTAVSSYERGSDSVLRGYVWTSGTPKEYTGVAVQQLSGDGQFAAGLLDGSVLLLYANGAKQMLNPGTFRGDAVSAVNQNGSLVVGWGWDQGTGKDAMFRWTIDGSVQVIQPRAGFPEVFPRSLNAAGDVMVGVNQQTATSAAPAAGDIEAFYWDQKGGMRSMLSELGSRGLTVPSGMALHAPFISADGSVLMGSGVYDGTAILWRARLAK
jgi:uncharacterized membrane protein